MGLILWSGRSPGEGNGYTLIFFSGESMDRGSQRYIQGLIDDICEYDPIWKQELYLCNQAKTMLLWIRVGHNPMTIDLIKEGKFRNRDRRHEREGHVKTEAEIRMRHLQVKEHQKLLETNKTGKRQRRIFWTFRRVVALLTSEFQTSGLQNYRVLVCCFKPPSL